MAIAGDNINVEKGGWSFGGSVPKNFDTHVSKSVPLYYEGHNLICDLSDFFIKNNSVVYEIGCSTGTLSLKLAEHHKNKKNLKIIGLDIEIDMINEAMAKKKVDPNLNSLTFENADALLYDFEKSDLIICYYTIQFTAPAFRQDLINKIYQSLNWGGAFLLFEKVRGADARFQDILSSLYVEFKLRNVYSADDIIAKTQSLKGVMEPFSTQGNLDLLKRAGFSDINTIQKYICFEGFLAIK